MPAPLGRTPTRRMPKIEVFGTDDSPATRAALRFFRERRIVPLYADLRRRRIRRDELAWFAERLGAGVLAEAGRREPDEAEGGDPVPVSAAELARVAGDPRRLRLPLVRHGREATAGPAEATWRSWLARG